MLVTLSSLSRGSLYEISDRWESVDADLIVYPAAWGENITTISGIGLSDKYADKLRTEHAGIVRSVTPVFLWPMKLAGQDQMAAGIEPDDLPAFTGGKGIIEGTCFAPAGPWTTFIQGLHDRKTRGMTEERKKEFVVDPTEEDLSAGGWLDVVIDNRLAAAGGYKVGQTVLTANHHWKVVGIVPAGSMTRVFLPRASAQFLYGADMGKSTLMFVKLKPGVVAEEACRRISGPALQAVQLRQYRAMLEHRFGVMFLYVDMVNAVALVIAFLFIMVTLYTMVLQRTREIAILKASGASNAFIMRQVLVESMLLTAAGAAVGGVMSAGAAWAIQTFKPLLTVTITWHWVAVAGGAALAGAILSGLYPAWRATRIDVVEALTLE
jgi:ABC-type multidrug transport system permease subunit